MPQRRRRLQSQRDSELMSCLVSEARKEAGMAAEKIHGVRKGGRRPAAWILVLSDVALPEPGAEGEGMQACQDPCRGAVGQLEASEQGED